MPLFDKHRSIVTKRMTVRREFFRTNLLTKIETDTLRSLFASSTSAYSPQSIGKASSTGPHGFILESMATIEQLFGGRRVEDSNIPLLRWKSKQSPAVKRAMTEREDLLESSNFFIFAHFCED